VTIILSRLNRKKNSLENAIVQLILKLPLYLAYVTTLPQLMPAKVAVNDKFQSMVATYLRFDGDVSNQIEKGLLLSLRVKFFFKY